MSRRRLDVEAARCRANSKKGKSFQFVDKVDSEGLNLSQDAKGILVRRLLRGDLSLLLASTQVNFSFSSFPEPRFTFPAPEDLRA